MYGTSARLLLALISLHASDLAQGTDYSPSVLYNLTKNIESRTFDGSSNNKLFPTKGQRETVYTRTDSSGINNEPPAGYTGDNKATWVTELESRNVGARFISNTVNRQPAKLTHTCKEGACKNSLFTTFGQMCVLDMTHSTSATEAYDIPIPSGDVQFDKAKTGSESYGFTRSKFVLNERSGVREQINSNTHFLDAEAVYGYNEAFATAIRKGTGGLLKTSDWGGVPEYSEAIHATMPPGMANACPMVTGSSATIQTGRDGLYLSGNRRMNSLPQLVAVHTLFVREHNRRANKILELHSDWTDEEIYQKARAWVVALIQCVFYEEYLPLLIGTRVPAGKYDSTVDPSVDIFAGTVGLRYGHSEIPSVYGGGTGAPVLRDSWFHPEDYVYNNASFVKILTAMMESKQEVIDPYIVDDVRHYTFSCDGQPKHDLAARNIQRGRDNGLPSYVEAMRNYGLVPPASIDDITTDETVRARLKLAYGEDGVASIDPWIGALSEQPVAPSALGPLMTKVLLKQFARTRNGECLFMIFVHVSIFISIVSFYRLRLHFVLCHSLS